MKPCAGLDARLPMETTLPWGIALPLETTVVAPAAAARGGGSAAAGGKEEPRGRSSAKATWSSSE